MRFNWSMYSTIRESCRLQRARSCSGSLRRASAAICRTVSGVTADEAGSDDDDIEEIVA
jgi:hypothetical protein